MQGALNLGHQPDDVVELFIHLMPYIGVPRVVHGDAPGRPGVPRAQRPQGRARSGMETQTIEARSGGPAADPRAQLPDARLRRPLLPRAAGDASRRSSRAGARAARIPQMGTVMLLRYADVHAALLDRRLGAMGVRYYEQQGWSTGPYIEWVRRTLVFLDPPDHDRLRALLGRAFTPRQVARVRPIAAADRGAPRGRGGGAARGRPLRRLRAAPAAPGDLRDARHPVGRPRAGARLDGGALARHRVSDPRGARRRRRRDDAR